MTEQEIQEYLQGKLSDDARLTFEKQMESDPSFATEVRAHKNMRLAIEASERKELKNRLQELERTQTRKPRLIKFALAASFAVLVGLGSLFFLRETSGKALYADNFEAYPNVLAPISRGTEPAKIEDQYFVAYEKGEYSIAITGFQSQLELEENDDVRFYLGMAFLNSGEKTKARIELEKIKKKNTAFYPQTLWYLALIHLENDDFVTATELLNELATIDTGYKEKDAREILKEL